MKGRLRCIVLLWLLPLLLSAKERVMSPKKDGLQLPVTAAAAVVDVDKHRLLTSIGKMLQFNKPKHQSVEPCTIFRVRDKIRNEDPGAFDPQIISIGPFHRGKNPALLPMELIKPQFLSELINRDPSNTLEKLIDAVSTASLMEKAKDCYSEQVIGTDGGHSFVEMMVLDGCFIIEFLVKSFNGDDMKQLDYGNQNRSLIESDLLLLENQIPFSVLESLFDAAVIPCLCRTSPPITLKELTMSFFSRARTKNPPPIPDVAFHLLHLRLSSLTPSTEHKLQKNIVESCTCWCMMHLIIKRIQHIISHSFYWVLSLLLNCRWPTRRKRSERVPRMTLTATELHEAGVKLEIKENAICFLDVTFQNGTMEIPMISIQAGTISEYRNLIAFEQCCPLSRNYFTAYVSLLDNLINSPEDVALLKRNGVMESKLSSDEEVSLFFNSLGKGSYLSYEDHYLTGLFKEVKEYCAIERHGWRAKLVRDYFSNPWSAISLAAAIFLLLLTILQSVFAILAYVRPP